MFIEYFYDRFRADINTSIQYRQDIVYSTVCLSIFSLAHYSELTVIGLWHRPQVTYTVLVLTQYIRRPERILKILAIKWIEFFPSILEAMDISGTVETCELAWCHCRRAVPNVWHRNNQSLAAAPTKRPSAGGDDDVRASPFLYRSLPARSY